MVIAEVVFEVDGGMVDAEYHLEDVEVRVSIIVLSVLVCSCAQVRGPVFSPADSGRCLLERKDGQTGRYECEWKGTYQMEKIGVF